MLQRALLVATILLAGAVATGAADPFSHPSLAAGDYDALVLHWLSVVEAAPEEPGAEVLLRGMERLRGQMVDIQGMRAPLERVVPKAAGLVRILAARLLVDCCEEAGDWEAAARWREELGLVRAWSVIGTYGTTHRTCFDQAFPPEVRPDDPALAVAGSSPSWRALPPAGIHRSLDPFDHLWPRRGAAYALAQFRLDAPAEGVLTLWSPGSARLWVNDRPALVLDRGRAFAPVEAAVRVALRAGWNRLLVKVVAGSASAFQIYLTDAAGRALRPAAVEEGADVHPPGAAADGDPAPAAFSWPAAAHFAGVAADPGKRAPREVLLAALLSHWGGDEDEALFRARAAAERAPDDPAVLAFAAEMHLAAVHCPETWRRNRAQELLQSALRADPGFAPAGFALAELLESDHKVREAIDGLHAVLAAHPRCFYAHFQLLRLYRAREWEPQAEAEVAALEGLAPGSSVVAAFRLEQARGRKNWAESLRQAEKLAQRRAGVTYQLCTALEAAGERDRAIALWRELAAREPRDSGVARRIAEAEDAAGRPDAAEAELGRVLRWVPDHAEAWRELGDVRLRAGRVAPALEAFRTALGIDPSDAALRRQLAWLERKLTAADAVGDADAFWEPWEADGAQLVKGAPTRRDLPSSSVAYLLDQAVLRIHPDGSHSEYIHQTVKILNERGVDEYDKVDIQGEILEARTITQDGSILEPVVIPGERELTMPRVTDGVVIDYAFRRQSRGRPMGRFEYPNFYFQDPNFDGAFLLSEMVVLVPKGFPFRYAEVNMPAPAQVSERGEWTVYHWRVQNAPHIEPEGHMPHFRTLLPYVQVGSEQTWDEVWAMLREPLHGRCRPTRDLREWAQKAAAGRTAPREIARAVYEAALAHVRDGGGLDTAQSILSDRTGNRLVLIKTALDVLGVPAVFVATRPNAATEPAPPWSMPRPDLFDAITANGLLLRVDAGYGEWVWLSGAGRTMPFGEFPADRRGGWGLVLDDRGPELATLPVGDPGEYATAAERTLGTRQELTYEPSLEGPTRVIARVRTTGPESSFWKERFADVDAARRRMFLETVYNATFPGLVVEALDFPDLERPGAPFAADFTLRIRSFLTAQGERISCGLGVIPLKLQRAFVSEARRKLPIHLSEPYGSRTRAVIRVPAGARCARIPEGVTLQSEFGSYSLRLARIADAAGEAVEVLRTYRIPPQDVAPGDYARFIEFCRAVDQAEGQRIVLERT